MHHSLTTLIFSISTSSSHHRHFFPFVAAVLPYYCRAFTLQHIRTISSIRTIVLYPLAVTAASKTSFTTTSHRLQSSFTNSNQQTNNKTSTSTTTMPQQQSALIPPTPWKVFPSSHFNQLTKTHGPHKVKLIHIIRHAEGTHNVNNDYTDINDLDARLTGKGISQCQSCHPQFVEELPSLTMDDTGDETKIENTNGADEYGGICVLTSPLTRCIQTALYCFPHLLPASSSWVSSTEETKNDPATTSSSSLSPTIPFIALESIRETLNFHCDRRRSISQLSLEYPQIDFSLYQQNDNNNNNNDNNNDNNKNDDDTLWNSYLQRSIKPNTLKESSELHKTAQRGRLAFTYLQSRPERQIVLSTHSAFLRCVLNWGQVGDMPLTGVPPQVLDDRVAGVESVDYPLFEYYGGDDDDDTVDGEGGGGEEYGGVFETYMRRKYDNCELRSFCLLVKEDV